MSPAVELARPSRSALEVRLIVACVRMDGDVLHIQALLERGLDWQTVIRTAQCWGLEPLLYTSLRRAATAGQVPQQVLERLRLLYHREAVRGVMQRHALRATLLQLSEANVSVVVLKDAVLAVRVYPSPTLRPMRRIDLLVRRRDFDRADAVLRSLREISAAPGENVDFEPRRDALSLLNLRSDLFEPPRLAPGAERVVRIPIEDLWKRAQAADIESLPTLVPSWGDLLLHLALDLAMSPPKMDAFVDRLGTLCDVAETCKRTRQ